MVPVCLAQWSPTINMSKRERTSIPSLIAYRKIQEEWLITHKLGSKLGEDGRRSRRSPKAIGQWLLPLAVDIVV